MLKMKRMRFPKEIILVCIRWYAAYALSYRNLEEMMQERGISVDHSTVNRWAIRFLPVLENVFRGHKRPVGGSWQMDETYIKVRGHWKYLYRAVDQDGMTIDFLLRAKQVKAAAMRFFRKAMRQNGEPAKVTLDKSGANKAAMDGINQDRDDPITVRQIKYLNNIVEQDHRAVKRITKPVMGFKSFHAASNLLAGIELMHMIRKGQMVTAEGCDLSFADQFTHSRHNCAYCPCTLDKRPPISPWIG
jgi:putative transposase